MPPDLYVFPRLSPKIHLNQLSNSGLSAKLPSLTDHAVLAGTTGREFRLMFRVVGDDAMVLESKYASPS
jgi:hypothetical protein